jgi:hypothetical protein
MQKLKTVLVLKSYCLSKILKKSLLFKLLITTMFLVSIKGFAYSETTYSYSDENQLSPLNSVVKVLGTSSVGSGTLVSLGGEAVILTNSHILKGEKEAFVSLPEFELNIALKKYQFFKNTKIAFSGLAKVLLDFPSLDLTVLKLPNIYDNEIAKVISDLANSNARFCPGCKQISCGDDIKILSDDSYSGIAAVLDDKVSDIPLPKLNGYVVGTFNVLRDHPDSFLTSQRWRSMSIALFARPGVSGGALFQFSNFCGIITKVSTSLTAKTYAIPRPAINQLLNESYFNKDFSKIPTAEWLKNQAGKIYLRHYFRYEDSQNIEKEVTIDINNGDGDRASSAGGSIANGGGSIANGGGSIANGGGSIANGGSELGGLSHPFLKLNFFGHHRFGFQQIETANPFHFNDDIMKINNEPVSYISISATGFTGLLESIANSKLKMTPTLTNFMWSAKTQGKKYNVSFTKGPPQISSSLTAEKIDKYSIFKHKEKNEYELILDSKQDLKISTEKPLLITAELKINGRHLMIKIDRELKKITVIDLITKRESFYSIVQSGAQKKLFKNTQNNQQALVIIGTFSEWVNGIIIEFEDLLIHLESSLDV